MYEPTHIIKLYKTQNAHTQQNDIFKLGRIQNIEKHWVSFENMSLIKYNQSLKNYYKEFRNVYVKPNFK